MSFANDDDFTDFGLVCEVEGEHVKVFTWKNKLVTMNGANMELEIGQEVGIVGGEIDSDVCGVGMYNYEVINGELYIQTEATIPNALALPEDLRKKYGGKVWSPWLHMIGDPNDLFSKLGRLTALVTVKYNNNPRGEEIFDVVKVEEFPDDRSQTAVSQAPWKQELFLRNSSLFAKPRDLPVCSPAPVVKDDMYTGICVAKNIVNPLYDSSQPGSPRTVCIIWSYSLGQIRTVGAEDVIKIGAWYTFKVNKKTAKTDNVALYFLVTAKASYLNELSTPPLPTRVVDSNGSKELEVDVYFTFHHDALESPENRAIANWDSRKKTLFRNAHFNDHLLGPVEVYPDVSAEMIKAVEAYRSGLNPERRELLKHDAIQVYATLRLLKSWESKYKQQGYPIFFAYKIKNIRYGVSREPIYN